MKVSHCDLCGKEIDKKCAPIVELTALSSTGKQAKMGLVLKLESLITKKDLGVPIAFMSESNYGFLPSLAEMERETEGYDVCDECWGKILKSFNMDNFQVRSAI